MAWAYFQNQAAWDTYHDAVCAAQGIPRPGYLASDDATVMIDACWTDAWTDPLQFKAQGNVTTWIAQVSDEDVTTYNLTAIPDSAVVFPPLFSTDPIKVTIGNRTYTVEPTTLAYRKAKPAIWVDPRTNISYPVPP